MRNLGYCHTLKNLFNLIWFINLHGFSSASSFTFGQRQAQPYQYISQSQGSRDPPGFEEVSYIIQQERIKMIFWFLKYMDVVFLAYTLG